MNCVETDYGVFVLAMMVSYCLIIPTAITALQRQN